ncbi:hypothetical protein MCOL2_20916 [Listeria fleischmannii FSL S10-1203]|uniref:Uncharacterized protein n=1 Tax=Listeria fleischmannii FSL S10-1203 TaxID=1265822 RepID=W7CSC8_9LIST|nr:hypothetical protein MCOL2_20916 [Listeria fleischmannii FSL S10-1203]
MKNKYLLAYDWINWPIVFFLIILLVIMNLISVTVALSLYIFIMFLNIIQVFLDDKIEVKRKKNILELNRCIFVSNFDFHKLIIFLFISV